MRELLDRRRLNRATLARQLLLQRAELPTVRAVEHLVGLQSQAPLSAYVGLWSRLHSFDPVAAGAALERGELIRTHAMRATIHLLSRQDALGLRALLQPMLASRFRSSPFPRELPGVDLAAVCEQTRRIATARSVSRVELGRSLAAVFPGLPEDALAYAATYLEPMVQVPPRGVWGRRGPVRWRTFGGWLGVDSIQPARVDDVVLRYLGSFGPATVADVRIWSGLPALGEVVDRLRNRLRVFRDEGDRELFDLPEAPRPDPDQEAPVRFLPEYDNVLLSYADRSRVIPDRRVVPLPPGDGARVGTVLVDGDLRATWRLAADTGGTALQIAARPRLSTDAAAAVTAEGHRLLAFLHPENPSGAVFLGPD